jgi:hypothetical protein
MALRLKGLIGIGGYMWFRGPLTSLRFAQDDEILFRKEKEKATATMLAEEEFFCAEFFYCVA